VDTAIGFFGRIDILNHDVGIVRRAQLEVMSDEDFQSVLDVHLRCCFYFARAAYSHMQMTGYGRIVLTGLINGSYGNRSATNYSVAKVGSLALASVVAIEGVDHGIKANVILPAALTRMAEGLDNGAYPAMEPEQVTPAVGWLCHKSCTMRGEMFISAAGRIARACFAETPGVYRPDWTIERAARQIEGIRSDEETQVFAAVPSGQLDHLRYSFAMGTGADNKNLVDQEKQ
jgi:NAD(P)-dependent dehydrogenase (short-subunit alcohol dehydrogenase family)